MSKNLDFYFSGANQAHLGWWMENMAGIGGNGGGKGYLYATNVEKIP